MRARVFLEKGLDRGRKLSKAVSRGGRDGDDRDTFERRAFEDVLDFRNDKLKPLIVHEIALRDGHEAATDVQQVEDGEVLARLGHHRLIGCHHEQGKVNPAHAREHVVDEPLVPRNVYDADLAAVGKGHPREAEVDGQPALLLLLEAVRVDAGERVDERGLAVVDVSRRSDNVQRVRLLSASLPCASHLNATRCD